MRKQGKRTGKIGYGLISASLILMLTACSGTVNAGTKPGYFYPVETKKFGEEGNAEWFNGESERTEIVRAEKPVLEGELLESVRIPDEIKSMTPELCSRIYVRILSEGDISDIRPLNAVDEYGKPFIRNKQEYRASGFPLEDGWYVFFVPNGIRDISVLVGNQLFGGKEDE